MSVIDELQRLAAETTKTVTKKSSDFVEIAKLNIAINAEEEKIQRQYLAIGRRIYEAFSAGGYVAATSDDIVDEGAAGDVSELCWQLHAIEINVRRLKDRLLHLRNVKECQFCNEILDSEMVFCHRCGKKQPAHRTADESGGSGECGKSDAHGENDAHGNGGEHGESGNRANQGGEKDEHGGYMRSDGGDTGIDED
jgi:hypothetical protein